MSIQSGKFVLPQSEPTVLPNDVRFPPGAYRANLYVYDPFGRIDWYALVPSSFVGGRFFNMGRGPDCNISLNDGAVSTRHAYIAAESGQLVLRDLESTNGTWCNGAKVREQVLTHGDVVRVGATDIRFLYSYRDSPVQLVLAFVEGRNAGRTLATTRASTQIGRLNCAINLQGAEVAAQHVRIDAFGAELLFVVTLQRQRPTFLNGRLISGIVPARAGDRLRVGDHEIILRVAEPDELAEAQVLGDGTLLIKERTDSARSADPVLQLDPSQLPGAGETLAGADELDEETVGDAGHFLSPTRPPEGLVPGPTAEIRPQTAPLGSPESRWRDRQGGGGLRTTRRALLLGVLLTAVLGGAALYEVPRTLHVRGRLAASDQAPLVSPVRGRLTALSGTVGEAVKPGTVVARLVDLDAQAEVDRLTAAIDALEREVEGSRVVRPGTVAPGTLQALEAAERAQDDARQRRRAVLTAFNRRELGLDALEAARTREAKATQQVASLRRAIDAQRARQQVLQQGPSEAVLARIASLVARKEALQATLQVTVTAHEAGQLAPVPGQADRPIGGTVAAGAPLYMVLNLAPLRVIFELDAQAKEGLGDRQELTVYPSGLPGGRPYQARLVAKALMSDGRWQVRGMLANPGLALHPGQAVHAEIELPPTTALALGWAWLRRKLD